MYRAHFGIAEPPFAITPDPRYLYLGTRHAEALAHLVYGVSEAGGFIQLTGEVGTGKTTIIRSLLSRAPQNAEIALIINPRMNSIEFLQTICEELGLGLPDSAENNAKELVDLLNRYDQSMLPESLTSYLHRREFYDYEDHSRQGAKHGHFVDDETCDRFCILGSIEDHVAKLRALEAQGVEQFNIYLMTGNQEETLRAYGEEIIPRFSNVAA